MNFLLGILFVSAPVSLALKIPGSMHGFRRTGKVPANVSGMAVVDEAIKNAPKFLEDAIAFGHFMNGSHRIFDALHESTSTPRSINSFLELERKIEGAMQKSHALAEIKDILRFGSKRLHRLKGLLGIDSINIGLARSGAPWYSLMKSLAEDNDNFDYFDKSDVQLVGDVAFFLNVPYQGKFKNLWRICFAAGLYAQIFFKGTYYPQSAMVGSDFGGEDLYFAFANTANVPGWSWSMSFNHDYVTRNLDAEHQDVVHQMKYQEWNHQYAHLSRLAGGFEFASQGPLRDLVAINFNYCIMGRSQGGACIDRLAGDTQTLKNKEAGYVDTQDAEDPNAQSLLAKLPESGELKPAARSGSQGEAEGDGNKPTWEDILNQEKWSKNTVTTGVGHCWCNTKGDSYWKQGWDLGTF